MSATDIQCGSTRPVQDRVLPNIVSANDTSGRQPELGAGLALWSTPINRLFTPRTQANIVSADNTSGR